jgi:hypothetical protein
MQRACSCRPSDAEVKMLVKLFDEAGAGVATVAAYCSLAV